MEEWMQLKTYLIDNGYSSNESKDWWIAKSLASTTGWTSAYEEGVIGYDQASNNRTGFSAFPGGMREKKSWNPDYYFNNGSRKCVWWSTVPSSGSEGYAKTIWMYYTGSTSMTDSELRKEGVSIRCVKD